MQTPDEIRSILAGFNGTQTYWHTTVSRASNIFYTDGVKTLLKLCESYWLLHLICSYQSLCQMDEDSLRFMQFWTLRVDTTEGTAVLICERDTGDLAISHKIEFTDFPLDEIKIWLEIGMVDDKPALVAMLPGER